MSDPQIVRQQGGMGDAPVMATLLGRNGGAGEQVKRDPDEALDVFEMRCVALARARGARMVVLAGPLPVELA